MSDVMRRLGLGLAVAGLVVMAPGFAGAQRKRPAAAKAVKAAKPAAGAAVAGATAAGEPQARVERTERGGKVIKLTPIVVEGKVQKPLALVLARSQVRYDWEQLKKDFTPKIVEAVSKSPF
jgi:hypothetical protein